MELVFQLANEMIVVKIEGKIVLFSTSAFNFQKFVPIEGLKLNKEGILKEHPDLKDLPFEQMKQEAIKRFRKLLDSFEHEEDVKLYVIKELEKHGYVLKTIKQKGFRPINVR